MFADREDAGRQLARELEKIKLRDPVVLAIPRGGVVTGAVLAEELDAELDVVLARKLRAPFQPELAIGAIGEDGAMYVERSVAAASGANDAYLAEERDRQLTAIAERRRMFRGGRGCAPVSGRSVILTDDGIATGSTMIAALHVVNALEPDEVIVAVPVAPADRLGSLREHCDRLICLVASTNFRAVGQFYEAFEPVEDCEVAQYLDKFRRAAAASRERA
jgi:predicted phosphoribosyltransferase